MRGLALILALLPSLAAAQSLDEGITGGRSVVASRYQFGSTGGDWPSPVPPTIDCRLPEWSSGTLDCGGAVFTPSGNPTAGVPTYWRPGGGAAGAGVGFDGVDDYLLGPTSPAVGSKILVCANVTPTNAIASGYHRIFAKGGAGTDEFILRTKAGAKFEFVAVSDGTATLTALGSATAGVANSACVYYEAVADGSSIVMANVNGSPASASNAAGPLKNAGGAWRIGTYQGTQEMWPGEMSRVSYWDLSSSSWTPTAADLARMVRSQYAAQGSLGEPVTWTRASTKSCQIGGAWFTVPANQPCIGSDGALIEGADTNYLVNACASQADQTTGSLAAGAYTLWMEGAGSVAAAAGTAVATGLPCTATAASACAFTISTAGTVAIDVTGAVTAMQLEGGARSSLICSAATPAARAADAVSASHGIADPNRWCVRIAATATGWRTADRGFLSVGTVGSANSAYLLNWSGGTKLDFALRGADNAEKYVRFMGDIPDGAHVFHACADNGTPTLWMDGVPVGTINGGTGNGVFGSLAASVVIGANGSGSQINAPIPAVTTCNTSTPEDCQ